MLRLRALILLALLPLWAGGCRISGGALTPLAEGQLSNALSTAHIYERIREDFDGALHSLQPWMEDDLGDFELGVTPEEGRTADFRRSEDNERGPEIPRSELGRSYAEGRWSGTADLRTREDLDA